MDMKMILRWSAGDPVFEGGASRAAAMEAVKLTIYRLGMPDAYEVLRRDALGVANRKTPQIPSSVLLRGLLNNLRFAGFIYPTGPVPDGRARPPYGLVPLTPHQSRILLEYAGGWTTIEISERTGLDPTTLRKITATARKRHGLRTTSQLVSYAYFSNWFPGRAESLWLIGQPYPLAASWGLVPS